MDVGSILEGGFKFVVRRPRLIATWAAIYAVVAITTAVALQPFNAMMASMQQHVMVASSTRVAVPAPAFAPLPSGFWLLFAIVYVVLILAWVIAFAAVVRAVVDPGADRFAFLRVGMDEMRLIGLGLLLVALAFAAEIVVILAIVLVVGALTVAAGTVASGIVAVLAVFLFLGLAIWAQVRLSLAGALTVIRKRIVVQEAWRVTRGSFWTLFAVYLVIGMTAAVVTMLLAAAFNPQMAGAYLSMNPQGMMAAVQERLARQSGGLSPLLIVQAIAGAVVNTALGSIAFAAIATAAQEALQHEQFATEFA